MNDACSWPVWTTSRAAEERHSSASAGDASRSQDRRRRAHLHRDPQQAFPSRRRRVRRAEEGGPGGSKRASRRNAGSAPACCGACSAALDDRLAAEERLLARGRSARRRPHRCARAVTNAPSCDTHSYRAQNSRPRPLASRCQAGSGSFGVGIVRGVGIVIGQPISKRSPATCPRPGGVAGRSRPDGTTAMPSSCSPPFEWTEQRELEELGRARRARRRRGGGSPTAAEDLSARASSSASARSHPIALFTDPTLTRMCRPISTGHARPLGPRPFANLAGWGSRTAERTQPRRPLRQTDPYVTEPGAVLPSPVRPHGDHAGRRCRRGRARARADDAIEEGLGSCSPANAITHSYRCGHLWAALITVLGGMRCWLVLREAAAAVPASVWTCVLRSRDPDPAPLRERAHSRWRQKSRTRHLVFGRSGRRAGRLLLRPCSSSCAGHRICGAASRSTTCCSWCAAPRRRACDKRRWTPTARCRRAVLTHRKPPARTVVDGDSAQGRAVAYAALRAFLETSRAVRHQAAGPRRSRDEAGRRMTIRSSVDDLEQVPRGSSSRGRSSYGQQLEKQVKLSGAWRDLDADSRGAMPRSSRPRRCRAGAAATAAHVEHRGSGRRSSGTTRSREDAATDDVER